jgi:hypothetical protein
MKPLRGTAMHIVMSIALTLMRWPEFRFLRGNCMGIGNQRGVC